jgi:hypothetical protein
MIPQAQSASHQHLAVPLLWITPALWSVSYIVVRSALGVIEPHMLDCAGHALMGWHHVMGTCLIFPGVYLALRKAPEKT